MIELGQTLKGSNMIKGILVFFALFELGLAHEVHYFDKAPLEIVKIGHPVLRKKAQNVELDRIGTTELEQFIDDMFLTMKKAGGVGLAAPQVGVSQRLFVMGGGGIKPTAVINPQLTPLDQFGMKNSAEGCLSIPGQRVRIKRYRRVHLDYFDREGEWISRQLKGFEAIVAQHEYDHLEGILMIDYKNSEPNLIEQVPVPKM